MANLSRDQEGTLDVSVETGGAILPGHLWTPPSARGLVVFAHGSGSGRDSPRNQHVARTLNDRGFATLLFDLLTEPEAADRDNVFNIALLSQRLVDATRWSRGQGGGDLPVGLFGASTGAAAALTAAVELGGLVRAVVSRGGRPDLCDRLPDVKAPVLLIVGSQDHLVLDLNRDAAQQLTSEHAIEVVEGATHLFEEPGTLDRVAEHASRWFADHL
jgi:putative phosphoribosyl transferase